MNRRIDPFSLDSLNRIFKLDKSDPPRLKTRENSWLEFKESFNWGSRAKYAKTMAAFANAQGGYIVFGIKRRPHEIMGLKGRNFENLDSEKVTGFLNKAFSPEIAWEQFIYEVAGKKIGILYVFEALSKPVVCTSNEGEELKDGDIYYRYRGRSQRIKQPELREILEQEKQRERELWLRHLRHMAKVGVSNVGILDAVTGEVSGPGGRFLISEELLKKIAFIREGHFTESSAPGTPTLRLVGNVEAIEPGLVQPVKRVHIPKALNSSEIISAFLNQEKVVSPTDYVKQICYESSGYLPVYWFIHQAGQSIQDALEIVKETSSRSQAKKILIRRLNGDDPLKMGSLTASSSASKKRREFLKQIKDRKLPGKVPSPSLKYFFEAISHLNEGDFDPEYLFPYVRELFKSKYENTDSNTATIMRKAISHLDKVMYRKGGQK